MSYELTDERIMELAENEVKQHVHRVMQGFARDNYATSEGYDIRMEKVMRATMVEYFNYHYANELKPLFEKIIKEVVLGKLPELIVDKIREEIQAYD